MYGVYYHFNNLRFGKSRNIDDCSAANVVVSFVSSEFMKCRLPKGSLDHPTNRVAEASVSSEEEEEDDPTETWKSLKVAAYI